MHWFAVMAVSATAGLVKKLIARHRHGNEIPAILEDPPGVCTLARFGLVDRDAGDDVLVSVAAALGPEIAGWVDRDAVRAQLPGRELTVDVVRLSARGGGIYTLELTRAWTGTDLGAPARGLLVRIHQALTDHPAVHALAWHERQDRALLAGRPHPVALFAR